MRRLGVAVLVISTLLLAAPTSGADPKNGEQVTLECGDATFVVTLNRGGGTPAFDATGGSDGRVFLRKSIEGSFYAGELSSEPIGQDPLFTVAASFGRRVGQGQPLTCTLRRVIQYNGAPATGFLTVEVTTK